MVQGQQAPPGKTWTMKTFLLMLRNEREERQEKKLFEEYSAATNPVHVHYSGPARRTEELPEVSTDWCSETDCRAQSSCPTCHSVSTGSC